VLIFYSEEYVDALHPPHVPHQQVLCAIADHLAPDLAARIPTKIVEDAIFLAALGDDVSTGIDVLQEHIAGQIADPEQ
jgi:hypothetical protein